MSDTEIEKKAEEFSKKPHYTNGQPLTVAPQLYLKRGFIAGYKAKEADIEEYKTALEDIIEAIPGQTDDKDWWPDDLRAAIKNAEKLLNQ